jgi:hypothetical protein
MVWLMVVAGWAVCGYVALRLFIAGWRADFDLTRADLWFFRCLSVLGPLSLSAAAFIYLLTMEEGSLIVLPKKEKSDV